MSAERVWRAGGHAGTIHTVKTAIRLRWPEVRALFEDALDVPFAQRTAWVRGRAADAELRDAVLAMLADEPATLASAGNAPADAVAAGATLGSYRVLRTLGRGGMGVVYLGEQQSPKRLVAIKLLAGRHDVQALARFRREAEVLAVLSHPGIAHVIEADEDDGRPFLVMEFVAGVPLAEAARTMSREKRLELLARIADAVGHAHARGVVHRDLKPSNILVTDAGAPKVVDFGIASLAGAGAESLTETGMLLGTPAYMAPEQASGEQRIDARADVYALGAIGFELLTDRLPLPVAGLAPLQALRVIKDDTPPPLGRVDRGLRGDLERIFEKAMAKERELRYANASAFADDLRRWRSREPIHARAPGSWRRLVLFGRRNPAQLALMVATVVSLVAGLVASLWFAWGQSQERARAVAEAQRAQNERARVQATLAAINQMFTAGNPTVAGHPDVLFREALASAAAQVRGQPAAVRAPVLFALAEAQKGIGEVEAAIESYAESARLAEEAADVPTRLRAKLRRAELLYTHVSHRAFAEARDDLLAEPALARDPLVHAFVLELAAQDERWLGHRRTSDELLDRAFALWPVPERSGDEVLRAELEVLLLVERARRLAGSPDSRAALLAQIDVLRSSFERLRAVMGDEHPLLVSLRLDLDVLPAMLDQRPEALTGLIDETKRRMAELGAGHPGVLARIDVGLDFVQSAPDSATMDAVQRLAAQAAHALPTTNRWRARTTADLLIANYLGPFVESFTPEEIVALADARCRGVDERDADCASARVASARAMNFAGRPDDAVAILRAVLARQGAAPDAGRVGELNDQLQRVLRQDGRFDEAMVAVDAAIAATERNTELDEDMRDRAVYLLAWGYRPNRCDRALAVVEPRYQRLATTPSMPRDPLERLMATCAVRAGRDPAAAIARLDAAWRELAADKPVTSLVRMELVLAYLEIYDHLGRDADFARWARELRTMVAAGLPAARLPPKVFPFVARALALRDEPPQR